MVKDGGKRLRAARETMQTDRAYSLTDALTRIIGQQGVKFIESVDVDIQLGIDPRQSDQQVRGQCVLPHGTGKTVRVAVFATGDEAKAAKDAGADIVGDDDLVEQVEKGMLDFDRCIATPKLMSRVGRLGRILGPRNLMPNPKLGTVTTDVAAAVRNAKSGSIEVRADKGGSVHTTVGRKNFTVEQLVANVQVVLRTIDQLKPTNQKGRYLKRVTLSSTMGPGYNIDVLSGSDLTLSAA